MHGLGHHLAWVQPLLERYGYGAVFLAILAEGMGVPAPGQALLIAAALLAGHGQMSLGLLLPTATVASAAGNLAGFYIGRWAGRRILGRIAAGPRLAKMEGLFQRHGGLIVAFGRFVDGTRQLGAIVAGSLGMTAATFFIWNLLGAVVWVGFWALGAFWFARDFAQLALLFHHLWPLAFGAALLVVALALRWLARGGQARSDAASPRPS